MDEFVYIVIEREFIKCNESVYKVGRTKDMKTRLQGYHKGTKLLQLSTVSDSHFVENQIKKTFKEKFKQRTDIGTEYFEGTCVEMLNEFNEIVKSSQLQLSQVLPPELNMSRTAISDKMGNHYISDETGNYYFCSTCNFQTSHIGHFRTHIHSKRHINVVKKMQPLKDDTNVFQICFNSLYESNVPVPDNLNENDKNRVYCSCIWDKVKNCDVYITGNRQNPREYSRNWGKKNFHRWIRVFTTVFRNSDKREFILSHRYAKDGEAME